jgi:squalene-associated FAD-dependent desaturase
VAAPRIAVVGGGLAGLAAAMDLQTRGFQVTLFERSRLLGGRATSFEVAGHVVDNGQHVYLACCTEFIRFVQNAGCAEALYLQDRFDVVAFSRDGKRSRLRAANLPAPFHLLLAFAGYKHLSLKSKIEIAGALAALKFTRGDARTDGSFAQWLHAHHQGAEAVHRFWEPFMVPALNAPLERMDAAEAAFVISTAFLSHRNDARFGYSRIPLAQIMEAVAGRLERVARSTAVMEVRAGAEEVLLRTAQGVERFDAAVLAVPPRALARLLGDPARAGLPPLEGYEPFAIMDVHLWYDGEPAGFDFAAMLESPVQWVFQKASGYLCCSISAAGAHVATPTGDMVSLAWQAVCRAVPSLAQARLVDGAATRNPEGTYLALPGTVRPGARTAHERVAVAGAWTATGWPDTMESAVRSGFTAARVLMESEFMKGETSFG